ncbi:MAG: FG-GAP repeat domain-containing protein [Sandaracinaceae bacterium]
MDKVWATFRTLGVLVGLWAALAVAGIAFGVIPIDGLRGVDAAEGDAGVPGDAGVGAAGDAAVASGEPNGSEPPPDEEPADPETDVPVETAATPVEAADTDPAESEDAAPSPATRWTVCATSGEPSLTVAQVFGDASPEILVGCADGWHVLGLGPDRVPFTIAVFTVPSAATGQRTRVGGAAVGDVDGDGVTDLVLPLAYETDTGATRGGALYWLPRSRYGGVRDPIALAPIAGVSAAVARLDANAGAEVLAINRTNALAQLPSEAWVFAGGAAPSRLEVRQTGLDGQRVHATDIDRDGHDDAVVLSRGRVDLHFGDGQGAFSRTHTFELEGAREVAFGDLDGDGGDDLAVLGGGLRWIRGGPVDGMEPRGIDGVPATLRGLELADVDGDGKLDFIGWDHPRLAVLHHRGELAFVAETGFTLDGPLGPRRHRVVDLDQDGRADDVVLLGTTADEDAPLELLLLTDAFSGGHVAPQAEPRPVVDAPLVLRATLPE